MGKTPKFCPAVPCAIELLHVAGAGEPEGELLWVLQGQARHKRKSAIALKEGTFIRGETRNSVL